jgi:hypothetical protein
MSNQINKYKNSTYLEVNNNLLSLLIEGDWSSNSLDEKLVQSLLRNLLYNLILSDDPKMHFPLEERVELALRTVFNEVEQITHDGLCDGLPQYVHDIIDSYKAGK